MSVFTLFRQTSSQSAIWHNLKPRGVYSWHPTLSQQDPASRGWSECASSVFFHYRSVLLCPPSPLPGMGVPACPAAKVTVQKTWWTGGLQPGDQVQGNLTVLILSYYDAFPCGQGAPADDILCAKLKVEARGRMRSDQRKLPRRRAGQRLLLRQPARLGDCVRGQGHQSYQNCVCGQGLLCQGTC